MDKESAHNRLLQAIDYLKDNGRARNHGEIAELSNTSRSNVTSAIGGNPRYITEPFLKRFASAYSGYINENWLLTGEGRMEAIDKSMRPHYKATVAAGVLTGVITDVKEGDVEYEPIIKRFPRYDFTIDVEGHSMEPTYWDKDVVACRRIFNLDDIKPGQAYVIATKDGAVLKRISSIAPFRIRVLSDNDEFTPYYIDRDSIIAIYEVVGSLHTSASQGPYEEHRKKMLMEYINKVITSRIEYSIGDYVDNLDMDRLIRDIAKGAYQRN